MEICKIKGDFQFLLYLVIQLDYKNVRRREDFLCRLLTFIEVYKVRGLL